MSSSDYDETPYPGYCYPQSSPARLATVATLMGMSPPDLGTARVLEFGSGVGANLLPLAARHPDARFVGIDYSPVQTAAAQADAAALGLANVEFLGASILDLTAADLGGFDYVIAHGFYSWVPDPVRERMMALIGEVLSPQGVAYVSYNTLPGWNALRTVRDAMLFHSKESANPAERARKAREMLRMMAANAGGSDSPFRRLIAQEAAIIDGQDEAFLLHDYMEDVNAAFYLSDFVEHAAAHRLQFLGDALYSCMPLAAAAMHAADRPDTAKDPVRWGQYFDFMTNRRFRMTLLVRAGVPLLRHPTAKTFARVRLACEYRPKAPVAAQAVGRIRSLELVRTHGGATACTVSGRTVCACVLVAIRAGAGGIDWRGLIDRATADLGNVPRQTVESDLAAEAGSLIMAGILSPSVETPDFTATPSERPRAFAPAVLAAGRGELVPNMLHGEIRLTPPQRDLIRRLDGAHTLADLQREFAAPTEIEGHLRAFAESALLAA